MWLGILLNLLVCEAVVHVKLHIEDDKCQLISQGSLLKYHGLSNNTVLMQERPAMTSLGIDGLEHEHSAKIIDLYGITETSVHSQVHALCPKLRDEKYHPISSANQQQLFDQTNNLEKVQTIQVQKIIDNGDPTNRIDIVFMGDGYTLQQKPQFFSDIKRLTSEMFEGETFRSWLPLFNIWAIFVESKQSGIGNGSPKQTAFKLYREKDQLRAIFPGDSGYARRICKMTGFNACDYPSIIANDDYYGGLGGEFVIATRSVQSGTIVLRHEMGHNFAKVGEEYDSGQVYSGVNASPSTNVGWKHWLSGPIREEKAMYRILEYPWYNLNMGPKSFQFNSDGKYSRWLLTVSMTGSAPPSQVQVKLDGKPLTWVARSNDREFYDWEGNTGFSSGSHQLTISGSGPSNSSIPLMVASVNLHEFGNESEFTKDNRHISAYPTWDYRLRKTYRPTNAFCLMRNMTSPKLCPICKEGIWSQFLTRISLIDRLDYTDNTLTILTPNLGALRPTPLNGESLLITWSHQNEPQPQLDHQFTIPYPAPGTWQVTVQLITPEIKYDPNSLSIDKKTITI